MARIENLIRDEKNRNNQHEPVECRYYLFTDNNGNKILQLDTYAADDEQRLRGVKQTMQFSPEALRQLKRLLEKEF